MLRIVIINISNFDSQGIFSLLENIFYWFKYCCLHFHPTISPHPYLPPLNLHPLALSLCPLYIFLEALPIFFSIIPLPPLWLLSVCSLFQCLWLYFACLFVLLIRFHPAIPPLGLYPKNPETPIQKNLCTPMFTAAQFTIAKFWKQPKCPSVNEWIKSYDTFTQWNTTQQKERRSSYPS